MLIENHEDFEQLIYYFQNKKVKSLYSYDMKGTVKLISGDPESADEQEEGYEMVQRFIKNKRKNGMLASNTGGAMEFGFYTTESIKNGEKYDMGDKRYHACFRLSNLDGNYVDFMYDSTDDYIETDLTNYQRVRMLPHWFYYRELPPH